MTPLLQDTGFPVLREAYTTIALLALNLSSISFQALLTSSILIFESSLKLVFIEASSFFSGLLVT
ncbi:hypothetical protein D3C73_1313470 [compost metagenome]